MTAEKAKCLAHMAVASLFNSSSLDEQLSAMSSDDEELPLELFQEPPGYYPPPDPHTFSSYTLASGQVLEVRLVGHNPLWVISIFHPLYTVYHACFKSYDTSR